MSGADAAYAHRAAGWNFHHVGRHADALREAQRALENDPHDAEAHRLRALSLSMLKRHDEAMEALAAALAADPRSDWSHRLRALVLVNAGQMAPALECAGWRVRPSGSRARSASASA
jgi:tetratricopeptide (TPR) repeat protein